MKKIIGSPIGLEEVNLTVDNRVRRRIKEYFGNVDDNRFEIKVILPENIKDVEYNTSKLSYIKIGVKAPKEHLNRTFIIELPNKYEFFIPTNKNGDWIESEPLFMSRDSFDIIKNQQANFSAKLPTTDTEKKAATVWKEDKLTTQDAIEQAELAAVEQALIDEAGKDVAKETDKIAKTECEAQECMEYIKDGLDGYCVTNYADNETDEKNKDSTVKDCDETDPSSCCASPGCIKKRKIFQRKGLRSFWIIILILVSVVWIVSFFKYSHVYVLRFGGFLLDIINFVRHKDKPEIEPNDLSGVHETHDGGSIDKLVHSGAFLAFISFILAFLIGCIIWNETSDPYLKPCEPDVEENTKNGKCSSGLNVKTCADGTQKCIKCGSRKHFNTVSCRCVNDKSSSTSSSKPSSSKPSSNKPSGSSNKPRKKNKKK